MSKRAHIRRRQDSDDEDNSQSANEDSNGANSNDGSDSGYVNLFLPSVIKVHFPLIEQILKI